MKQKTIKKVAELNGWEFDHKGMEIVGLILYLFAIGAQHDVIFSE